LRVEVLGEEVGAREVGWVGEGVEVGVGVAGGVGAVGSGGGGCCGCGCGGGGGGEVEFRHAAVVARCWVLVASMLCIQTLESTRGVEVGLDRKACLSIKGRGIAPAGITTECESGQFDFSSICYFAF